jgi:hypothetical protein
VSGVRVVSDPVHLLFAGETFQQGYPCTSVAVCGELVTSGPDGEEDHHYCPECVRRSGGVRSPECGRE